jgi:hypothetical protein
MGKVAKVLIMAAVLLAVAAVAVGAQQSATSSASANAVGSPPSTSKQCYTVPCHGSANRETIYERIGDGKRDLIRGYGNNDRLHANTYTNDTDQVYAYGGGTDYIYVNDGDARDGAIGGRGYDYCYVDARVEASNTCDRVVVRQGRLGETRASSREASVLSLGAQPAENASSTTLVNKDKR